MLNSEAYLDYNFDLKLSSKRKVLLGNGFFQCAGKWSVRTMNLTNAQDEHFLPD